MSAVRLVGGSAVAGIDMDADVQTQLTSLLQQWGTDIVDDEKRAAARAEVARLKQQPASSSNSKQLFVYNPYRPQGGMGFRDTAMWEALLAELPAEISAEQKKRVAAIFRVDPEHNAAVQSTLREMDEECARVAEELVEKARRDDEMQEE